MPTLTLIYDDKPIAFTLEKIDRDKLYGYAETQTLTTEGMVCSRATLCGDGHTLAGQGDIGLAYLSPDGLWRERSELRSVDARDGTAIIPVKPTFAFPVNLDDPTKQATHDQYLNATIRLVYQLCPVGAGTSAIVVVEDMRRQLQPLLDDLESGAIYRFPFSYRGGDLADDGFILCSSDGGIYLAVGSPCNVEYASLAYNPLPDPDEFEEEEEEELDFSMV